MNLDGNKARELLRVFVVASDAEWVTDDILEQEINSIRKAMNHSTQDACEFRSLSTLDPAEFVAVAKKFRPNVIHFTQRGSATPYVRMFDKSGWIRRISGATLARYINSIGYEIQCIFFSNCTVWRNKQHLAMVSNCVVSALSKSPTVELPVEFIETFYKGLQLQYGFDKIASKIRMSLSNVITSGEVLLNVYEQNEWHQKNQSEFASVNFQAIQEQQRMAPSYSVADSPKSINELTSSSSPELAQKKTQTSGPRTYRVWFGTNRKPLNENNQIIGFTSERADSVYYGHCDISIPKYHTIGSLGAPWWKRFPFFWQNNRLAVQSRRCLAADEFWIELQQLFHELPVDDKTLLVFLHGYNVSFDSAALRAAQLGFDLGIRGTTAFFSWPSKGNVLAYPADVASLEASEQYIGSFITDLAEKSGAKRVHIIAHSMGNRGLLRAFSQMFAKIQDAVDKPFEQIFLAAPDVDVGLFKQMAAVYQRVAQRTTMYVCEKDKALRSSGILHDYPRAGYTPPVTVVQGIDTVEVSNIDLTYLGHGYVAEARPILSDMHSLIETDTPPDRRFGLEEKLLVSDMKYWRVRS